jgi:hypothetical protein
VPPLEQLLDAERVEVGWDASDVDAGMVFGDTVMLRMRAVDGPADVRTEPLRLPAGERGTATCTFPAPGRYTLAVTVEGHLLTGEPRSRCPRCRSRRRRSPHRPPPAGSC